MAAARKQAWLRDELVLALDLYVRAGRNPPDAEATRLSELLRAMPIEAHLAAEPSFRNAAAVRMKIANFVALDPAAATLGMSRGGRGDQAAWDEFIRPGPAAAGRRGHRRLPHAAGAR